jgi:FkbM family methyltransferase
MLGHSNDERVRLVFLDVGAHQGQSAEVALGNLFRFDRVISYEPDPACAQVIRTKFPSQVDAGRLVVVEGALGGRAETRVLHGSNDGGGASMLDAAAGSVSVACRVYDVAETLEELSREPVAIFMKLNCEGAEVEILDRICDTPAAAFVKGIMADFDIVKYPGGYFEKQRVLAKCKAAGLPVLLSEEVMVGRSHAERLRNWLARYPEVKSDLNHDTTQRQSAKRRLRYWWRDVRSIAGLQKHKQPTR